MAPLHRLPSILLTLALLLGAALPVNGGAVLCFGSDHVGVEAAGRAGGAGHCGGDGEPAAAAVAETCVDVAAVGGPLDRPAPVESAAPALLAVPLLAADRELAEPVRPVGPRRVRPPPHVAVLATYLLRV